MNVRIEERELDLEWIVLIKKAKALGMTKEEIQFFLTINEQETVSS